MNEYISWLKQTETVDETVFKVLDCLRFKLLSARFYCLVHLANQARIKFLAIGTPDNGCVFNKEKNLLSYLGSLSL